MRSRWRTLAVGLLLTAVVESAVLALVPITYSSSATVAVMPPTRPSSAAARNPLLGLDSSVHVTAAMLSQSMAGPLLTFRAGVDPRSDSVTTRNAAMGAYVGATSSAFVTVKVESPDESRSSALVGWLIDAGREDLAQRQHAMKVAGRNLMTLQTVVGPSLPTLIWLPTVGMSAATVLLGLVVTAFAAYGIALADGRRRADELAPVVPLRTDRVPTPPTDPAQPAVARAG